MKKHILLLVATVFAASTWTQAQTVLDFKLVNRTNFSFYAVYLTDTDTEDWGEDILPQDIVIPGGVVDITFNFEVDASCSWDLRLTEDKTEKTWIYLTELDLCEASVVTIFIDGDGEYAFLIE